jgi:hypothetical protein
MADRKLAWWSGVLLVLAGLTLGIGLIGPISLVVVDGPLLLTHGDQVWRSSFLSLALWHRVAVFGVLFLPQLAWAYVVVQVVTLARRFRRGAVFDGGNPACFERIGVGLAVMAVLSAVAVPLTAWLLYRLGECPWMADLSGLDPFQPDLFMAAAFVYVLGRVMRHGAELQEADALTV